MTSSSRPGNPTGSHRVTFIYAERSGLSNGRQWRASVDDYYEGAVIAAAAGKPAQGIGHIDGHVDFIVVCDGGGAWGAGRLVKTFPVKSHLERSVRRALVDPSDVPDDVLALVDDGFKPVGPNGGPLRQSMRATIVDGRVVIGAAGEEPQSY
jgi:hypothetical protein